MYRLWVQGLYNQDHLWYLNQTFQLKLMSHSCRGVCKNDTGTSCKWLGDWKCNWRGHKRARCSAKGTCECTPGWCAGAMSGDCFAAPALPAPHLASEPVTAI